jgi:hypothetical protein
MKSNYRVLLIVLDTGEVLPTSPQCRSDRDFLSFMHDKVFQPLGMSDTLADENDKIIPNRSRSY